MQGQKSRTRIILPVRSKPRNRSKKSRKTGEQMNIIWSVNSEPPFQVIAEGFKNDVTEIKNQFIYNQIVKHDKR